MKEYCVDLDVTFSKRVYIYAKDEESARAQALLEVNSDPYYHIKNGCWVATDVTDVFEC